ncbi:OmpA family protein [Terriglobus sp. RCC_193]|uniref:OmpA family protein n=1 Tax=Terriglobus sp. RCC_193 TaxID=3239218 RepID=UPI003523721F
MMRLQTTRTKSIVTTAMAAMLLLAGCHKKQSAPPPYTAPPAAPAAAPTATLTAEPATIDLGQSVVLTWHTSNATSVSIDGVGPVNLNGTTNVTPSNSTNFHLVATGDGGTAEANFRVTVRVPAPPADTGTSSNLPDDATFHAAVPDIFFDYDSYDLNPTGHTSAQQASTYLNQHPNIKLLIGGYCDERGSAEYNLALGENRANAAKTALVNAGVSASRIRVISYGKEKQFCTEQNESCWQQNRRAQFNIDR